MQISVSSQNVENNTEGNHLTSWCDNFEEMYSFPKVFHESPDTDTLRSVY